MYKCTSERSEAGSDFEEQETVHLVEEFCIGGNLDESRTGAWIVSW
jgi:hypothetical protein